nr:MAG TPA: hypothetical protein [Caudoviricetes sp.]
MVDAGAPRPPIVEDQVARFHEAQSLCADGLRRVPADDEHAVAVRRLRDRVAADVDSAHIQVGAPARGAAVADARTVRIQAAGAVRVAESVLAARHPIHQFPARLRGARGQRAAAPARARGAVLPARSRVRRRRGAGPARAGHVLAPPRRRALDPFAVRHVRHDGVPPRLHAGQLAGGAVGGQRLVGSRRSVAAVALRRIRRRRPRRPGDVHAVRVPRLDDVVRGVVAVPVPAEDRLVERRGVPPVQRRRPYLVGDPHRPHRGLMIGDEEEDHRLGVPVGVEPELARYRHIGLQVLRHLLLLDLVAGAQHRLDLPVHIVRQVVVGPVRVVRVHAGAQLGRQLRVLVGRLPLDAREEAVRPAAEPLPDPDRDRVVVVDDVVPHPGFDGADRFYRHPFGLRVPRHAVRLPSSRRGPPAGRAPIRAKRLQHRPGGADAQVARPAFPRLQMLVGVDLEGYVVRAGRPAPRGHVHVRARRRPLGDHAEVGAHRDGLALYHAGQAHDAAVQAQRQRRLRVLRPAGQADPVVLRHGHRLVAELQVVAGQRREPRVPRRIQMDLAFGEVLAVAQAPELGADVLRAVVAAHLLQGGEAVRQSVLRFEQGVQVGPRPHGGEHDDAGVRERPPGVRYEAHDPVVDVVVRHGVVAAVGDDDVLHVVVVETAVGDRPVQLHGEVVGAVDHPRPADGEVLLRDAHGAAHEGRPLAGDDVGRADDDGAHVGGGGVLQHVAGVRLRLRVAVAHLREQVVVAPGHLAGGVRLRPGLGLPDLPIDLGDLLVVGVDGRLRLLYTDLHAVELGRVLLCAHVQLAHVAVVVAPPRGLVGVDELAEAQRLRLVRTRHVRFSLLPSALSAGCVIGLVLGVQVPLAGRPVGLVQRLRRRPDVVGALGEPGLCAHVVVEHGQHLRDGSVRAPPHGVGDDHVFGAALRQSSVERVDRPGDLVVRLLAQARFEVGQACVDVVGERHDLVDRVDDPLVVLDQVFQHLLVGVRFALRERGDVRQRRVLQVEERDVVYRHAASFVRSNSPSPTWRRSRYACRPRRSRRWTSTGRRTSRRARRAPCGRR